MGSHIPMDYWSTYSGLGWAIPDHKNSSLSCTHSALIPRARPKPPLQRIRPTVYFFKSDLQPINTIQREQKRKKNPIFLVNQHQNQTLDFKCRHKNWGLLAPWFDTAVSTFNPLLRNFFFLLFPLPSHSQHTINTPREAPNLYSKNSNWQLLFTHWGRRKLRDELPKDSWSGYSM